MILQKVIAILADTVSIWPHANVKFETQFSQKLILILRGVLLFTVTYYLQCFKLFLFLRSLNFELQSLVF